MLIGEYDDWPKYHDQLTRQVRIIPTDIQSELQFVFSMVMAAISVKFTPPLGLAVPPFREPVGPGAGLLTRMTVLYWL